MYKKYMNIIKKNIKQDKAYETIAKAISHRPHSFQQPHIIFSIDNPYFKQSIKSSHDEIVKILKKKGYDIEELEGKYNGKPEKSVLVKNPPKNSYHHFHNLAQKLGQDSIIISDGYNHELHYLGSNKLGQHIKGTGTDWSHIEPKSDYSKNSTGHYFSHNLNFDNHYTGSSFLDNKEIEKSETLIKNIKDHPLSFQHPNIKLIHYSPEQGLKKISPDYHGVRKIGSEAKQGAPVHKMNFYYLENTIPENIVTSGAKSKYVTSLGDKKLYDIATDKDSLWSNAQKIANMSSNNPGVVRKEHFHQAIRDAGYHGIYNSGLDSDMSRVVGMFEPMTVEQEHNLHPKDFENTSIKNWHIENKSVPHANSYEWHDGHTDHHRLGKSEDKELHPHLQAHGPTEPKNEQAGGVSEESFKSVMGNYGTINPSQPSNLKFYKGLDEHGPAIDNMLKEHGFEHYYAGGEYGKPDLANKNYNTKHLMVYNPKPQSGGDFGDEKFTDAWRKAHELAHALTYPEVNKIYGEGRRLGKLGVRSINDMQRAVHWEHLATHKQRQLMQQLGYNMSDADFHKEYNTVMGDAVHRAITGKFTEPSEMGFQPHGTHKVPLEQSLKMIEDHGKKLGLQNRHHTLADLKKLNKNEEDEENSKPAKITEDEKVYNTLQNLKEDKQSTKGIFSRVYSIPSQEKMQRSKTAVKTGQVPSSINIYGSHYPVVRLADDGKTVFLHTSQYGNEGKTEELIQKISTHLPSVFPDAKVIEIHHPDYRHSAKVMRMKNPKHLEEYLNHASQGHPDENYRQHAIEALNHLRKIKKAEYSKPIHSKRIASEGWDYEQNLKTRLGRLHKYLTSIGLTPDLESGEGRSLGASSPSSFQINLQGDPHDQQVLHEAAHAMATPVNTSIKDYQHFIGSPGFLGKLQQTKSRDQQKLIHEGGMPEETAQQMEAGIARRAGVEPFRSPKRGAKETSSDELSRKYAKQQLQNIDEGISTFDPFTGVHETGSSVHAVINARARKDKGIFNRVHEAFKKRKASEKNFLNHSDEKLAASENIESDLTKGSLQRKIGNPKKKLQDHESQIMINWSDNVINRKSIPEAHPKAKQRFFQKLHSQTEVRKHPKTGERMFLMHRGVHPVKTDYHEQGELSSWTPFYRVAKDFADSKTEEIANYVNFNKDGSVLDKDMSFAQHYGITHKNQLKPRIHSAWIPESAVHNYINNAMKDKERVSLKNEQEYIVKPHKFIYANKKPLKNKQLVNYKINERKKIIEQNSTPEFRTNPTKNKLKNIVKLSPNEKLAASEKNLPNPFHQKPRDYYKRIKDIKEHKKRVEIERIKSGGKKPLDEVAEKIKAKEELKKGSLQSKNPFNPHDLRNRITQEKQREWTHDESDEARLAIPQMKDSARLRALNKLMKQTHVRRHPETGERMFLMHRGMGLEEFNGANKNGKTTHEEGTRTSWSPIYDVAEEFGTTSEGDKVFNAPKGTVIKNVISAWIPESHLIHSINQFNAPSKKSIEESKKFNQETKNTGPIKIVKQKNRSQTEKFEQEWIVEHRQDGFHHANLDALAEQNQLNSNINRKAGKSGDKASYKAKDITQIKPRNTHQGQYGWKPKEKLAASENIDSDLTKGSLQRKMPFNPKKDVDYAERVASEGWQEGLTNNKGKKIFSRKDIPRIEGNARKRALLKLMKATEVRKHPETGERMFLMHRGHHIKEDPSSQRNSWTPDREIAEQFANYVKNTHGIDKGQITSAWIPESQIHHIPKQLGNTNWMKTIPKIYGASGYKKQYHGISDKTIKEGVNTAIDKIYDAPIQEPRFNKEHEVIVEPHDIVQAQRNSLIYKKPSIHKKINQKASIHKKINQKASEKKFQDNLDEKLAASEKTQTTALQSEYLESNLEKLSQPKNKRYLKKARLLQKGAITNALKAGVLATAIGLSNQVESKPLKNTQNSIEKPKQSIKHRTLASISQVESSGGKNIDHKPLSGIHQGERAFGKYGLTPVIIRETVKKNPDLSQNHSALLNMKGQQINDYMTQNPDLEHQVASKHYDRLASHFGHEPHKIGYAWLNGISGTKKALREKKPLKQHWHVKKILKAFGNLRKQESLEKEEIKNAIQGGLISLAMLHGANEIGVKQNVKPKEVKERAVSSNPKPNEKDILNQTKVDVAKEVNDIARNNYVKDTLHKLGPVLIKETIKKHPELQEKYGFVLNLSHPALKEIVDNHPELHHEVGIKHYDRLAQEFNNDHEKIDQAWKNGILNTKQKYNIKDK